MSTEPVPHTQEAILRQELEALRRELEVSRAQLAAASAVQTIAARLRLDPWRRLPTPVVRIVAGLLRMGRRVAGAAPFPHRPLDRPVRRPGATLQFDVAEHGHLRYARVLRGEVEPLVPRADADGPLRIAILIPPFDFGSGGHAVVVRLGEELARLGHAVSYWHDDPFTTRAGLTDAGLRDSLRAAFGDRVAATTAHASFSEWSGADVVVATGWQTAYTAMQLPGCAARAYLVNDHEPEFYPTSIERMFAEATYGFGLAPIVGGGEDGWLERELIARYGQRPVATYDYPVDERFAPRAIDRRDDTVVIYGRMATPRRGVGLAMMAIELLHARRPGLRVVLFGDTAGAALPFPYEHLGPIGAEELSWVYSEGTVGVAFSLTHASLVPNDMMACGLPVVSLDRFGTGVEHERTGLVELSPPDPYAIADAIERLLDDPSLRAARAEAGIAAMADRTWATSARSVEAGLRQAIAEADVRGQTTAVGRSGGPVSSR